MTMYHVPDEADEALRRGQELVRQAGQAALDRERQEAEAKEKAGWAEVDAQLQAAEVRALEMYRQLAPIYAKRASAAEALKGPLSEFWAAENELRSRLDEIAGTLSELRVRLDPLVYKKHVDRLRASAGIPVDHAEVEAGDDLATTIAKGIIRGHIFAGGIRAKNITVNLGK